MCDEWAGHAVMDIAGYGYLALAMCLVNLVPPLPAEASIPFASALFDRHGLNIGLAIGAATAGLTLGTLPFYVIGRVTGEARFKRFVAGPGRWSLITPADVERSGRWFTRYGALLVIVGRLVPGMRSMISLPAGFHRMPFVRFLACTIIGSAAWASVLVLAGHWLSHALMRVTALRVGQIFIAIIAVMYVIRLIQVLKVDANR